MKKKKTIEQITKYFTVGIIGGMINLSVLLLLTEFIHFNYMISAVYAFMSVSMISFILDKTWTFKEKVENHFLKEYLNFFSFSVIALLLNLISLYFLTTYFQMYYIFSQVLAISSSGGLNFFLDRSWTFQSRNK